MWKTLFLSLLKDNVPPPHQCLCGLQGVSSTAHVDNSQVAHIAVSLFHKIVPKIELKLQRAEDTHTVCGQLLPFLAVFKHLSEVLKLNFQWPIGSWRLRIDAPIDRSGSLSGEIPAADDRRRPAGFSCLLYSKPKSSESEELSTKTDIALRGFARSARRGDRGLPDSSSARARVPGQSVRRARPGARRPEGEREGEAVMMSGRRRHDEGLSASRCAVVGHSSGSRPEVGRFLSQPASPNDQPTVPPPNPSSARFLLCSVNGLSIGGIWP